MRKMQSSPGWRLAPGSMPSSLLFWDVDTQADFIYPDGKLYVPGAENIVPNLKRLTDLAASSGILVISSACAHRRRDPEFAQYPPHCLVGTPGQRKIPQTRLAKALSVPNRRINLPGEMWSYQQIIVEKQQLDVFSNPNIEALLKTLGPAGEVILYGVVTEICVAHAARGLLRRGYRISLVVDAVRHLEESRSNIFFEELKRSGGKLIETRDLPARLLQHPAA